MQYIKHSVEDFQSLVNRNQIFAFFHIQSSVKMPVGEVSLSFEQIMMA